MIGKENFRQRNGKIALVTALMLVCLIGIMACAFDIGWIAMTKTQLHGSTDSSALAGGTELLPGLGLLATSTPGEVDTAVRDQSVDFASRNRAGDASSVFINRDRDVVLGTGYRNLTTGGWDFQWGVAPYNAVQVTGHRDQGQNGQGDDSLRLFFAPILGQNFSNISVLSTAVILPGRGIRISGGDPGSGPLMPFAFEELTWDKYKRAKTHFENVLGSDPSLINTSYLDEDGITPLYFKEVTQGSNTSLAQEFDDAYGYAEGSGVSIGADGLMEFNIFPINQTPGNYGTVDVGSTDNSNADIKRQILDGVNEDDLSYFDGEFTYPTDLNGDTGISAGMQNSLDQIIGDCRAVLLFDAVSDDAGNNTEFSIVDMIAVRLMFANLSGNKKVIAMQPCHLSHGTIIPDWEETIGDDTTIFSPLILAQ